MRTIANRLALRWATAAAAATIALAGFAAGQQIGQDNAQGAGVCQAEDTCQPEFRRDADGTGRWIVITPEGR